MLVNYPLYLSPMPFFLEAFSMDLVRNTNTHTYRNIYVFTHTYIHVLQHTATLMQFFPEAFSMDHVRNTNILKSQLYDHWV